MTIALIALALFTVYLIVDGTRKDRRLSDLDASFRLERASADAAHRREVQDLCQRIQAPELAVIRHEVDQAAEAPQPPTDDETYWAQAEEHREMIARLEAIENAPFDRA